MYVSSPSYSSANGRPPAASGTQVTVSMGTERPPAAVARSSVGAPGPLGSLSHRRVGSGGGCFLFAVIFLMLFIYLGYVSLLLLPWVSSCGFDLPSLTVLVVFNVLFGLQLTAFFKAVMTDPGQVPPHWGFYMGDESKRRRYCKVCNVWKPDRTHHCSACGRW